MVVGDIINDVLDLVTMGITDFQPAAGVEIILTGLGHTAADAIDQISFGLYDGVNNAQWYNNGNVRVRDPLLFKFGINNTNYLRMFNGSSINEQLAYTGIQTK